MAVTDSDAHVRRQESVQIDETLLQRIGAGEKEAFLSLYEQVSNAVFAYALSLVKNRADAEDIMQDTFLKIRSAAHLYEPMGKPMAWILTITRNLCMMHFRKAKHIGDEKPEDLQISLGTDRIRETEDRIVLETAFRILSDEERKIIILHAVSGMRHREIADLMEMPLATVLSKYNRGLKKLKKELEGKV
ncbi:MAG: sigma-70 family RNA polymerase sigma factor [Eubacterium sp.]|nr:sigma-70 family RNA polymerase sigma factor [Eubacterium sp.]